MTMELSQTLAHADWIGATKILGNWVLSGCYDSSILIWDVEVCEEPQLALPGHSSAVKALAWLDSDEDAETCHFVSASHDESAIMWRWNRTSNSVECLQVCEGHSGSVNCIDVNQNLCKFATGSFDQKVNIWSSDITDHSGSDESNKKSPDLSLAGHKQSVVGIQWLQDSLISCSMDNTIRFWDLEKATHKLLISNSKAFLDISYCPSNKLLAGAFVDPNVQIWDLRESHNKDSIKDSSCSQKLSGGHSGWVSCVAWSPKDPFQLLSGSYDCSLCVWDLRCPKRPLCKAQDAENQVSCLDWSANNTIVAGAADNQLRVYSFSPD